MRISQLTAASALSVFLAIGHAKSPTPNPGPELRPGNGEYNGNGMENGQHEKKSNGMQNGAYHGMQNGVGSPSVGQIGEMQAPTPEYWVADASIFLHSAVTTAEILEQEASLEQHSGEILGNQAQFLHSSISRAINSLETLQADARESNPQAVSSIDRALTQLQAANQSAQQIVQASQGELLGEQFSNNVQQLSQSLQDALQSLNQVATAYNATQFIPGEVS